MVVAAPVSTSHTYPARKGVKGLTPAGHDDEAGVAVGIVGGDERPVEALLHYSQILSQVTDTPESTTYSVPQRGASVVANNVANPILHPRPDRIAVVQARDSRGNNPLGRPVPRAREAHLLQPRLVKLDLERGVPMRSVVQLLVRERVRHVRKGIHVRRREEPLRQLVARGALLRPGILRPLIIPVVDARTQRLLPLVNHLGDLVVVDGVLGGARRRGDAVGGGLDGAVAVVGELDEVVGAGGEARVDVGLPRGVGGEVLCAQAELGAGGVVDLGGEVDVVDLGAEVGLALARDWGLLALCPVKNITH